MTQEKSQRCSPRPSWRMLQILTLFSILLCILTVYITTWGDVRKISEYLPKTGIAKPNLNKPANPGHDVSKDMYKGFTEELQEGVHPIEHLTQLARRRFDRTMQTEAQNLEDASRKYRQTRGRHPPPGFDAWYAFATEKQSSVVEKFFDQIYHDLGPFWGIEPHLLRQQAHAFPTKISIRNGTVEIEAKNKHDRLDMWLDMLSVLASHKHIALPNMDIPVNVNDEPAMFVPWEDVDSAFEDARPIIPSAAEVIDDLLPFDGVEANKSTFKFEPEWLGPRLTHPSSSKGPRPLWSLVRPACHPDSKARLEHILTDIWHPQGHTNQAHTATALLPIGLPVEKGLLEGYIKNWTLATDPCESPNLQGLHGTFVAPAHMRATKQLFPLFGASKLPISNEILIPGAEEWNSSYQQPTSEQDSWEEKEKKLFWRGPASGGRNSELNWRRFHRHRFVSMLNATHIEIAEASLHTANESMVGVDYARNFRLLPANDYRIQSQTSGRLAEWVNGWADAALTDLRCHKSAGDGSCPYTNEYFSVEQAENEQEQAGYQYTATLDGDGGDSSNLVRSLRYGQTVVRASVYRSWYDDRIAPWLHFVPVDNRFVGLYAIMEYFVGTSVSEEAKKYSHAVGEVQKHEHHFQSPGIALDEEHSAGERGGAKHSSALAGRRDKEGEAHNQEARMIAEAGKAWAERALRHEDALVYVFRLLLEYARLMDDRRERLGRVD